MKTFILIALSGLFTNSLISQALCFEDPNTGAIYGNNSLPIYDITTGDFNGDGHLDVVTANSIGDNISFVPGYGNGTLGSADTVSVPSVLFCITSADFNGDNYLDVAVGSTGFIHVLFGNGDGTFQPYQSYAAAGLPSRIYSQDINSDNIPDLLQASTAGVYVAMGQSTGEFLAPYFYDVNGGSIDVVARDFDGDLITDLVSVTHTSWVTSELTFLKGSGDGSFEVAGLTAAPHQSIFGINSEDIDGNGTLDLIVSNANNMINRIEVYTGNGDGTFNSPVFYPTYYSPVYVYLVDADNDQILDILVPEGSGYSILTGNSDGTFSDFQYFVIASSVNGIAIGDYNEDGKVDFVVTSSDIGYLNLQLNCTIETGITESTSIPENYISIYPNPFKNTVNIRFSEGINVSAIDVVDCAGQIVYSQQENSCKVITIEDIQLSVGVYFVLAKNDRGIISRQKIMVVN
jgi:hypothetical protein